MKLSLSRLRAAPAVLAILALSACGGIDTGLPPIAVPATAPLFSPPTPAALAWTPALRDTWQRQAAGNVDADFPATVVSADLFNTSTAAIQSLQDGGKKVLCSFSAGHSDHWRPDFPAFQFDDMGSAVEGASGARWLDTASENVRAIMQRRLDLARRKGCDGVEPDHADGYAHKTGFDLTAASQRDYNRFLATEAHQRGLAIALKNNVELVFELAESFDLAINEQCHQYGECSGYAAFVAAGKPVFNAEYAGIYQAPGSDRDALCAASKKRGMRTVVLAGALDDSYRYSCDE